MIQYNNFYSGSVYGGGNWKLKCVELIACLSTESLKLIVADGTRTEGEAFESEKQQPSPTRSEDSLNVPVSLIDFIETFVRSEHAPLFINDEMIENLALKMNKHWIIPEIEIFDAGMISTIKVMMKKMATNSILTLEVIFL